MKKLFQLGAIFFGLLMTQTGYTQDYQGKADAGAQNRDALVLTNTDMQEATRRPR